MQTFKRKGACPSMFAAQACPTRRRPRTMRHALSTGEHITALERDPRLYATDCVVGAWWAWRCVVQRAALS